MSYLKIKNQANSKLFQYYEEEFLRKLKLRRYINTQRSESQICNNLERVLGTKGKKIALMYGDCNVGKQMRHIISTPMIGLKRTLKKRFCVLNVDEYRTSCLDYRTDNYNENTYVNKNGKKTKLHSVLVSTILNKNSEKSLSYQNRDRNSVHNIRKIVLRWFEKRERPERYRRDIKLSKEEQPLKESSDP